jgi:hypothetical protein
LIPVLILSGVVAAVVFAAAYAIFAMPRSRTGRKRQQEVINGFRLTGGILLGFLLMSMLVVGTGVALFGLQSSRLSSKPLALTLAVVAFGSIALMVQRWAKYFAGWIGYGVLNGLIMISSGHLVNNPAVRVSRPLAVTMTVLTLLSALVCLRFTENYEVNGADKLALLGWILAFTVAANAEKYGLVAFGISCAGLVAAYLYNRSHRHAKRKHRREVALPQS